MIHERKYRIEDDMMQKSWQVLKVIFNKVWKDLLSFIGVERMLSWVAGRWGHVPPVSVKDGQRWLIHIVPFSITIVRDIVQNDDECWRGGTGQHLPRDCLSAVASKQRQAGRGGKAGSRVERPDYPRLDNGGNNSQLSSLQIFISRELFYAHFSRIARFN